MLIHSEAQQLNEKLRILAPHILNTLSPLGLRVYSPKGIPFQALEAKACKINATIGQITNGAGEPLPLARIGTLLKDLSAKDAFLYSPIQGRDRCRKLWKAKLMAEDPRYTTAALPIVSVGICHALAMATDLFFSPGDTLVIPDLYWDNYDQIFEVRHEGRVVTYPFYDGNRFNTSALEKTLKTIKGKVHVLLNFPNNPTGYSPSLAEVKVLAQLLIRAAEHQSIIVYCDDAYHDLVFDPNATSQSLFFELIDQHPNLLAIKADGVTKELSFFGGRVGFLSFGVNEEVGELLNEKAAGLVRGGVGSPVGISQYLTEEELMSPDHQKSFQQLRHILQERYDALREALREETPYWKTFPFNAGCFCLLKLHESLDAEEVRQTLIQEESVGLVSHQRSYLRIAFCSIKKEAIPPLVTALKAVCSSLFNPSSSR